jgi:hypothetical protein
MPRTAGFNAIDYGRRSEETLGPRLGLMFIGGGSAGTAGGIKVGTFVLLAFVIWSEIRGEPDVVVGHRRIPRDCLRAGVHVVLLAVGVVALGTIGLLIVSDIAVRQGRSSRHLGFRHRGALDRDHPDAARPSDSSSSWPDVCGPGGHGDHRHRAGLNTGTGTTDSPKKGRSLVSNPFRRDDANPPVVIIGLGRFGVATARSLVAMGQEVLAVDSDPVLVQRHADEFTHVVQADSTDRDALEQLGVESFDKAVVGISNNVESSVMTAPWRSSTTGSPTSGPRPAPRPRAKILSGSACTTSSIPSARWVSRWPT